MSILRKFKCFIGSDTGYWKCGAMAFIHEFCSALHYLGEMRIKSGSTLANPKFSECCSGGKDTLHLFYFHHACNVLRHFETVKAWAFIQIWERLADHAESLYRKLLLLLQNLHCCREIC